MRLAERRVPAQGERLFEYTIPLRVFEIAPDTRVTARSVATKQSPATTMIRRGLLRLLAQARNDTDIYIILPSITVILSNAKNL